jgi:hypothetical protein
MLQRTRQFFETIRNADYATRRRWLFILSGASMVIVIAGWVGYLNIIVGTVADETPNTEHKAGIASTFNLGLQATAQEIKKGGASAFRFFESKIGDENKIVIAPETQNYILENLPPVEKVRLP